MKNRFGLVGFANHSDIYYKLRKELLDGSFCEECNAFEGLVVVPKLEFLRRRNLRTQKCAEWSLKIWYLKNHPKAFSILCKSCQSKKLAEERRSKKVGL